MTVRPFQGILYNPQRVDVAQAVAPPYDVITPRDQQRYYRQDPHNVVRLIAGEVRPSDSPEDNKYTRAAGFFNAWLREGILQRETRPCLYVYRHEFLDPATGKARARLGLLGVVELEPFGHGVLPHERTHARARADRLSLTRAVEANLSPVFALYEDPGSAIRPILKSATSGPPRLSIHGEDGDQHTVWSLCTGHRLKELAEVFGVSRLYIADGHHRYETALNFRNRQRLEHPQAPADAAFNYVLMLLVDVKDPGLSILPTHRVLHDLEAFDAGALLRSLSSRHRVVERSDRAALLAALQESTSAHRIGMALASGSPSALWEGQGGGLNAPSSLTGESRSATPSPLWGGSGRGYFTIDIERSLAADPVSELDVSVLHREILQRELGLEEAILDQERYVSYSRDVQTVLDQVAGGAAQAAFLLRPPAVADVVAVANAGQVMPQKSTYFYPKPASGIVFNPLGADIRI